MGMSWDKALPKQEAFNEMCRVLKPGALAFFNCSPRQDLMARMIFLLERAGFKTDVSFMSWIFKTGMPKAYDISKGIDKRLGAKREVIGEHPNPNGTGWVTGVVEDGEYKPRTSVPITAPATEQAKEWEGWKAISGLKPALEPILMAYKPLSEKTIVENVLKWGHGGINVDACRIPTNPVHDDMLRHTSRGVRESPTWKYGSGFRNETNYLTGVRPEGRFPANLLVSNNALDTGEITTSGKLEKHHKIQSIDGNKTSQVYGKYRVQTAGEMKSYGDSGDQSRYFDLDAWARANGIIQMAKPSTSEKEFGLYGMKKHSPKSKLNLGNGLGERFDGGKVLQRANVHPTVKPIKLGAYLTCLASRPNDLVLEPFCGSGTYCISAKITGRRYLGIDIDPYCVEIATKRVNAYPVPLTRFFNPKVEAMLDEVE